MQDRADAADCVGRPGASSDSRTGFSFGDIAKGAIAAADGPLNARLDAMEAALAPGMKAAINGIRPDFPEMYEAFRKGKVGAAVFASWEDDRPILIEEDREITPEGGILHERFRATAEQNLLVIGSGADAILRYVNRNEDCWKTAPVEALERRRARTMSAERSPSLQSRQVGRSG